MNFNECTDCNDYPNPSQNAQTLAGATRPLAARPLAARPESMNPGKEVKDKIQELNTLANEVLSMLHNFNERLSCVQRDEPPKVQQTDEKAPAHTPMGADLLDTQGLLKKGHRCRHWNSVPT
jgi:hypothetical protein